MVSKGKSERGSVRDMVNAVVPSDFISTTEAGRIVGCNISTVRQWIYEGDLPAYRLGRTMIRIRRSDLEDLIKRIKVDFS